MAEQPTANVREIVTAQRKKPAEVKTIIALFGNGEWPEKGGALTSRKEREFTGAAIKVYTGLSPAQFAKEANTVFHRLGATDDNARVEELENGAVKVWIRSNFHHKILPAAMAMYVSACDQRDREAQAATR